MKQNSFLSYPSLHAPLHSLWSPCGFLILTRGMPWSLALPTVPLIWSTLEMV